MFIFEIYMLLFLSFDISSSTNKSDLTIVHDAYNLLDFSFYNNFLMPSLFINCQDEILSKKPYVFTKKSSINATQSISPEFDSFFLNYELLIIDQNVLNTYNLYIDDELIYSLNPGDRIDDPKSKIFLSKQGNFCGDPLKRYFLYKISVFTQFNLNKPIQIIMNLTYDKNQEYTSESYWLLSSFDFQPFKNKRLLSTTYFCWFYCRSCLGGWSTDCLTCYTGYYLSNGYCLKCNSACRSCTGPTSNNCTSCSPIIPLYLYFSSGSCVADCPLQTYKNNATYTCSQCNNTCSDCVNYTYCNTCQTSYSLLNNECVSVSNCPISYYTNSFDICTQCDSSCLACNGSSNNNCLSCDPANGLYLYQSYCLNNCPIGTYIDLTYTQCSQCYSSCYSCIGDGDSDCTSCDGTSGLYLYQGSCLNFCPSGTFLNSLNASCDTCDSTCMRCDGPLPSNCSSCDSSDNFYLYQRSCINQCPSETFTNLTNSSCDLCDNTCLTCSGSSNNQCISCDINVGLYFYQNTCVLICPSKTFIDLQNYGNICQTCDVTCLTCIGPYETNCLSCPDDYPYYYEKMMSCFSTCPTQTFLDLSINQCLLCDSSCLSCNGLTGLDCLSCYSGLFLFNSKCITSCPIIGYYPDISINQCLTCHISCFSCFGPMSNNCNSCLSGSLLSADNECKSCQSGYYYSYQDNICLQCDKTCQTCEGFSNNQCLSCPHNLFLSNNSCLTTCPSGSYPDLGSQTCINCDISCEKCFGNSNIQCLACYDGTYLNDNSCISNCPIGKASNYTTRVCYLLPDLYMSLEDINNNPYYFLINFYPDSYDRQTYENLLKNASIIINGTTTNQLYNFSITDSFINTTSFMVSLDYSNNFVLNGSSYIKLVINNKNSSINLKNNVSNSLPLNPLYKCQNTQYFNHLSQKCIDKLIIDYNWKYSDSQQNVIYIQFTELNPQIINSLYNWMLMFHIDKLRLFYDYNHSISIDQSSKTLIYTFQSNHSIVGGAILDVNVNQSIYKNVNIMNTSIYLKQNNFSINLFDYYLLSYQTEQTINQTTTSSLIGSIIAYLSMYINLISNPGSSFPLRGLMLSYLIQLLKYLQINYPPNAISIFKNSNKNSILSNFFYYNDDHNNLDSDKFPKIFDFYGISLSFIENISNDVIQLVFILSLGLIIHIINLMIKDGIKLKFLKNFIIKLEICLIWNTVFSMFFSKFLNFSFFTSFHARYTSDFNPTKETFVFLVVLIIILYFPFHITKILNILRKNMDYKSPFDITTKKKNYVMPLNNNVVDLFKMNLQTTFRSSTPSPQKPNENKIYPEIGIYSKEEAMKKTRIDFEDINIQSNDKIHMKSSTDSPNFHAKTSISSEFHLKTLKQNKESIEISSSEFNIENLEQINNENKLNPIVITNQINRISINPIDWENLQNYVTPQLDPRYQTEHKILKNEVDRPVDWEYFNEYQTPILKENISNSKKLTEKNIIWTESEKKFFSENNLINLKVSEKTTNIQSYNIHSNISIDKENFPDLDKEKTKKNHFLLNLFKILKTSLIKFYHRLMNIYTVSDIHLYEKKYMILTKDLTKKKGFQWYYFSIDLVRIVILSVITTGFYGNPLIQIVFMCVVNMFFALFLIFKRPFERKINFIWTLLNEGCVNASYISALSICLMDKKDYQNEEERMNLGWTIVFSNLVLIYSIFLFSIFRIFTILLQYVCLKNKVVSD